RARTPRGAAAEPRIGTIHARVRRSYGLLEGRDDELYLRPSDPSSAVGQTRSSLSVPWSTGHVTPPPEVLSARWISPKLAEVRLIDERYRATLICGTRGWRASQRSARHTRVSPVSELALKSQISSTLA